MLSAQCAQCVSPEQSSFVHRLVTIMVVVVVVMVVVMVVVLMAGEPFPASALRRVALGLPPLVV